MKKNALVIGLGVSGIAAAELLLSLGYAVFACDKKQVKNLSLPIEIVSEKELSSLEGMSLVVPSSGVSLSHPFIVEARKKGIEVIGEADLALKHMPQRAIGITGTNGKTTVTSLAEHVLSASGKKAKALGNIGFPLSKYALHADPNEIAVIELSSYQLESLSKKAFDTAVILNVTPDHLDRYPSLQDYAKAKIGMERCMKQEGTLYVHQDVWTEYGSLFLQKPLLLPAKIDFLCDMGLQSHELENAVAAWHLCSIWGVTKEEFIFSLKTFKKPPHRVQFLCEIQGVRYYDDSKGTNVDAVSKAVDFINGPIILIAGGADKGSSYLPWKETLKNKVKQMFLIGETAPKIYQELALFFNVKIVDSLNDAVESAFRVAAVGDSVLLSPGCSSFDMFRNYEHRGCEFQRCVSLLEERGKES